jgi:hypothetical protein
VNPLATLNFVDVVKQEETELFDIFILGVGRLFVLHLPVVLENAD